MRKRIKLEDVKPGMILFEPVYDGVNILLDKGINITNDFINQLKKRDINYIYIDVESKIKLRKKRDKEENQKKIIKDNFNLKKTNLETENANSIYKDTGNIDRVKIDDIKQLKAVDHLNNFSIGRVEDKIFFEKTGIQISDNSIISKTVVDSIKKLNYCFLDFYNNKSVNSILLKGIVCNFIEHAKNNISSLLNYSRTNTLDNYVLGHTINVTVFSIIMGMIKNWDEHKMTQLGISSLVHDIGMIKVEDLIWHRPQKLNDSEMFLIKKHSVFGIDTLKKYSHLPIEICLPAYNHHECIDGTGYPRGKKGNLIDEFSKIIGLTDYYCALVTKRKWRDALEPKDAFLEILNNKNKFDNNMINSLKTFLVDNIDPEIKNIKEIKSKEIFIVDDQEDIIMLLSNLLKLKGHHPTKCYSVQEALRKMEVTRPDIILLDIMMPIIDGFEAIKYFRRYFSKIGKNIPIIMISARRDAESILKAKSLGITDYIIKPFTSNMLINKINTVLINTNA